MVGGQKVYDLRYSDACVHAAGLDTFPLRALAIHLADRPQLAVSVLTRQDGTAELEVLHTGPPHPDPQATRPSQLPPRQTLPLAAPAGLDDAVAMIRALIRLAATT
jgi:hypothetical protein